MLLPLAALNVYYTRLLRSVLDGIFTTAQIALARQRIEEGGFKVFDGVLETNDGRRIGEAGKILADAVIFSTIEGNCLNTSAGGYGMILSQNMRLVAHPDAGMRGRLLGRYCSTCFPTRQVHPRGVYRPHGKRRPTGGRGGRNSAG